MFVLEAQEAFAAARSEMSIFSKEFEYQEVLAAVHSGDQSVKPRLAWFMLSGQGGAQLDPEGAVKMLEERVKEGDLQAMWMLGFCCEYGIGLDQDLERTELLYNQSKDGGNEIGQILANSKKHKRGKFCLRLIRLCFSLPSSS